MDFRMLIKEQSRTCTVVYQKSSPISITTQAVTRNPSFSEASATRNPQLFQAYHFN